MAYQSLYRKYRPDTFDKVIGQEHIVTALVNQIRTGNIAHAYLLTGTRGTGKTSVARIFARAINCLSPVNGSPCGECEVCRKLKGPSQLDIVEIDAASNNSVDDARALRDSVRYAPVDGKYKVYIIDEVHQLSTSAFNALLKTLEEPPAHAVFILATTEVHKIPATIMSRCLRLDFRLVPQNVLEAHVGKIFDAEGISYTADGVSAIARAGEGSVRDTLSVADMCVSYATSCIDYDCVNEVLGANDPKKIAELAACILSGDVKTSLSLVEQAAMLGKSMPLLAKDLTKYFRDLIVVKNDADANVFLKLPDKLFEVEKHLAAGYDAATLLRALEIFSSVEANQRYSTQPKIILQTAIIKCATLSGEEVADLAARITSLEEKINSGNFAAAKPAYSFVKSMLGGNTAAPQQVPTVKSDADSAQPQSATQSAGAGNLPTLSNADIAVADLPFDATVEPPVLPDPAKQPAQKQQSEVQSAQTAAEDTQTELPKEAREEIKQLRRRILARLSDMRQPMVYLALTPESTLLKVDNGIFNLAFDKENDYDYCNRADVIELLKNIISEELGVECNVQVSLYNSTKPFALTNKQLMEIFGSASTVNIKNKPIIRR